MVLDDEALAFFRKEQAASHEILARLLERHELHSAGALATGGLEAQHAAWGAPGFSLPAHAPQQ